MPFTQREISDAVADVQGITAAAVTKGLKRGFVRIGPSGPASPVRLFSKFLARCMPLLLVVVCLGCAARTPAENAAILQAESLNYAGADASARATGIDNPSVIVPHANLDIVKVDGVSVKGTGIPGERVAFVAPGTRTLSVLIDTGMSVGHSTSHTSGRISGGMGVSSKVVLPENTITFTFEEGKHYTLDYDMGWSSTQFLFKEIPDTHAKADIPGYLREYAAQVARRQAAAKADAERLASYLPFSRQNPALLEGKWSTGEGGKELEFSGNAVTYTGAKSVLISSRPGLEGTFIFDRDTIVTHWEKYHAVLKTITRAERPDVFPQAVWYYTLDGDTLEIKHGGWTPQDIGGTYRRVRQAR
ncbi:hypothetical protein KL86DPRO_60178 [uncultured delta proteobacterium]|uniref:Uncharacterized protein n=1 Tax=uncultured delta proteobacterium TaxID=34034 RepID=A0A212KFK4_9DELT|nr:hypothetical protein KL86DPRO_60178 [uncultured delta proteobacterium]